MSAAVRGALACNALECYLEMEAHTLSCREWECLDVRGKGEYCPEGEKLRSVFEKALRAYVLAGEKT
jgi:hypothetical protein